MLGNSPNENNLASNVITATNARHCTSIDRTHDFVNDLSW
jgi:hypothetical protein